MSVFSRRNDPQPNAGSYPMQNLPAEAAQTSGGVGAATPTPTHPSPSALPTPSVAVGGLAGRSSPTSSASRPQPRAGVPGGTQAQGSPTSGALTPAASSSGGGTSAANSPSATGSHSAVSPTAQSLAAPTLDTQAARVQAHDAHREVPRRMDREGGAQAALASAQSATQALTERQTKAAASADAEAHTRQTTLNQAEQHLQATHAALPPLRQAVADHQQALQDNTTQARALTQEHARLSQDAALAHARQNVAQAQARLDAVKNGQGQPGAGSSGGPSVAMAQNPSAATVQSSSAETESASASAQSPQQRLADAQADLLRHQAALKPLEAAVTQAEAAVRQNTQDRRQIEQNLSAARDQLTAGEREHTQAQAKRDAAQTAVQHLQTARAALTNAVTQHTPDIQRHNTAAATAVGDAATATQLHRDLSAASARVADAATLAHQDHQHYQAQLPQTRQAEAALAAAQALLAPAGPLRTEVQRCQQALEAARAASASATGAGATAGSTATPGTAAPSGAAGSTNISPAQTVQSAQQALTTAEAAVQRQEALVSRLSQTAQQAQGQLVTLRATAESSQQALAAAEQARRDLVGRAATADRAAQTSAQARDRLQPAADTARDAIGQAVSGLCDALGAAATSTPAANATTATAATAATATATATAATTATTATTATGHGTPGSAATPTPNSDAPTRTARAKNAVQRTTQSLGNRIGPLKVDGTLGPFSASSSTNATTGFRDGLPPVKTVTTATDARALRSVDGKTKTAATATAALLAGGPVRKPSAAQTPPAFGNAVAFTEEISRMFGVADAATAATPVATRLADALLSHPNPDPVGRPDGHPLRHEQALLIASVLRSVTDDPATAAHLYNRLWSDPAPQLGGVQRRGAQPSPLQGLSDVSPLHDPAMQARVNEARRALAATSSGMEALLHLQGLSLPPANDPHRRHAEQAVEMYKLGLRAETEVIRQLGTARRGGHAPITVGLPQGREEIHAALQSRTDFAALSDGMRLGRGTRSRTDREDPATLAAQAFLYARANLERAPGAPDAAQHADCKPAYVALRNGFTESGQDSDFHKMAKRLHKFVKYIDLACASPVAGPGLIDHLKHPRTALRRKRGKDKTPLKTLMQAGPLGSNIGTVPGEHATRLRSALDRSKTALQSRLVQPSTQPTSSTPSTPSAVLAASAASAPSTPPTPSTPLTPQQHTTGLMRLAAMHLWEAQVPEKPGPLQDLSQGIRLTPEAVLDKAKELNLSLFGQNGAVPPALDDATIRRESQVLRDGPLLPGTLHQWLAEMPAAGPAGSAGPATSAAPPNGASTSTGGSLPAAASSALATTSAAATSAAPNPGTAPTDPLADLKKDVAILRGKAAIDNTLSALQDEFDKADVAGRREILRQVMISVVAGGDMTDYSDGRKNGIGGSFGYLSAQVKGLGGLTTGITPVGEFNLDHSRTAVLKAGVASNTGVIFLGSETKVTEMIGVGVRAGAQAGVVNMSAQVMARLGGAHLFTKGLMIRTNKQGEEHKDLDPALTQGMSSSNWKRMSELVVNSVFDIAAEPARGAGATRPTHGGEMWSRMVGKVGDFRDISFGWNTGQSHQATASLGVDGNVGVKAGLVGRFSAAGGVGARTTLFNRSKAHESSGATQTSQASSSSRTSLGAALSAGLSHPAVSKQGQPDVAVFARHKVGVETELVIQAQNGAVRITTMDGKVQPGISYKHREFAVEEDFMKMVNSQRSHWEQRLGTRREDGILQGGREALDGFLQQVANLPPGNSRMFIERKCLTQEAADTLTACMHRLDALERQAGNSPAKADQIQALRQQIAAQVADESSWQPFRLFVNQTQQRSRENGFGGEHRASGASPEDKNAGPSGFAERFLGGGRVTLGGKINTAHGGRDLITLDAMPVRE